MKHFLILTLLLLFACQKEFKTQDGRVMQGNKHKPPDTIPIPPPPPPPPPPPLPTSYIIQAPKPMNQGNEGSCCSFAVVYAGRSIEQYYRTGTMTLFSPEYVYDQVKAIGDCWAGSSITGNLDFLYHYGAPTLATVPYSDTNGCSITPTQAQIQEAAVYKIPTYNNIMNTNRAAIKQLLLANHPIVTGINIDNNFTNAQAGYIWNQISSGNAPHGIAVIGYDDSKNAYRIINSFGTEWGDNGFLWIDYGVYETRASYYGYVMNY